MKVYVPAINRVVHRNTVPSIILAGFPAFVFPIEKPYSYLDAFCSWWDTTPCFTIVDPNTEIIPAGITETPLNILEEFRFCKEPWCIAAPSLRCVKFTPKIMKINWTLIKMLCQDGYTNLDKAIKNCLNDYKQIPHLHRPGTFYHVPFTLGEE